MNTEVKLTPCELEITERFALLGETRKEVAQRTFRSVGTVETTLKNIYRKVGVSKVSELTLWYCARTFNISALIDAKKKEIIAICLLTIFSFDVAFQNDDFCRFRRRNRRKHEETEILVSS